MTFGGDGRTSSTAGVRRTSEEDESESVQLAPSGLELLVAADLSAEARKVGPGTLGAWPRASNALADRRCRRLDAETEVRAWRACRLRDWG